MRRFLVLVVTVVVAACGGGGGDADSGTTSGDADTASAFEVVVVTDFVYPSSVTVASDEVIQFQNESGASHTVTFDTRDDQPFDLDVDLGNGQTVDIPLDAGTYTYHCSFHPTMVGEVVVEG